MHYKNEHHEFQWEQAAILEIERDVNRRRLLEAIHIYIKQSHHGECILGEVRYTEELVSDP